MNTDNDLQSISFELRPPVPTALNSVKMKQADYGKILRRLAGINMPSIVCAAIGITFDFLFTLITLVIGASNINSCPIEPRIPIYLVVLAIINLLSIFLTITASVIHRRKKDENIIGYFYVTISAILIILLQLFNLVWTIASAVWTFQAIETVQYITMYENSYCQRNVYQYTIVTIVAQFVFPLLICICKNLPIIK